MLLFFIICYCFYTMLLFGISRYCYVYYVTVLYTMLLFSVLCYFCLYYVTVDELGKLKYVGNFIA
jgi:hypothetical protein